MTAMTSSVCLFRANSTTTASSSGARAHHQFEPFRSMDFKGKYPGNYASRKAAGDCVIDLGYGRWMSCDIGGGGNFP
jgi:hypothetical protein